MDTYTWILPIKVNTIQLVVIDKVHNLSSKGLPLVCLDSLSQNRVGRNTDGEGPSTKSNNALDSLETLEGLELAICIFNIDLVVLGNVGKGKVNMSPTRREGGRNRSHVHV